MDMWYDLMIRDLTDHDDTTTVLLKDAETLPSPPASEDDEAVQ
jgi:hypothetical protein